MPEIRPIKEATIDQSVFATANKDKVAKIIGISKLVGIFQYNSESRQCYDIEVDGNDHLFVLANGLIVSNSAKHTAGLLQGKRKNISGFKYVEQFLQSPEEFSDKGVVASIPGKVQDISPAPQGGKYITIDGIKHYVLPDTEIFVKKGDTVEAGDQLSDGLVDVEDILATRGIGEARKYFSERFKKLLDDSGAKANKKHTELLARSFIDKIEVTNPDGLGKWLPGDIISYNALEANYEPEEDSKLVDIKEAEGKYLQKPILHYSIGTKLTPKMIKHIDEVEGNDKEHRKVLVSDKEPGFKPVMIRVREALSTEDTGWLEKMTASYLKKNLVESAIRGSETNISSNTNPYARLSQPDFAKNIERTGMY